jgi:Putative beta barrel porin-7 (BBP7)
VNPNQIAPPLPLNGPARPAFTPNPTDFWVQGISVGAELRF